MYTEAKIKHTLALESVSRGVRHGVAQHLQNAAQRNAKLTGGPIIKQDLGHVPNYLGLCVYGHGVYLHPLQNPM
jgi:hypothetical protein